MAPLSRALGVAAILCVARAELQIADSASPAAPAREGELAASAAADPPAREGQLAAPEVVLQLKYDNGALNRIYLAQYRPPAAEWAPSVLARSTLCTDLCYAGLGGAGCGARCAALVPVGLTAQPPPANDSTRLGEPRVGVCPTLCANQLGSPLCECAAAAASDRVSWSEVCAAFCQADRYVLSGCPVCDSAGAPDAAGRSAAYSGRVLATAEGWGAWCDVQCRQGHGGAACNCDRSPFL